MISRVLVAMDGSELSEKALRFALDAHSDADITVLHVVGEPSSMMGQATGLVLADDIEQAAEDAAQGVFDQARDLAAEYDVDLVTKTAIGHPAREIINRAEDFDTVVIGMHSGSLADRILVGNIAKRVFRHSPVPVTVVR